MEHRLFDKRLIKQAAENTDEALTARYQKGEKHVINELLTRHKDLIQYKVNGYRQMPVPQPAIYAQGLRILAMAAQKYDQSSGYKFRTFLESHLKGLNRYAHSNKNILHFPENKMLRIKRYQAVSELLSQQYGKEPSEYQISDALGWSIPEVREFKAKLGQRELAASGLDNLVGTKEEAEKVQSQKLEAAEFMYYSLTPPEKEVYDLATGKHGKQQLKTDAEIAAVTNLSPSKVNRIRKELARRIQGH